MIEPLDDRVSDSASPPSATPEDQATSYGKPTTDPEATGYTPTAPAGDPEATNYAARSADPEATGYTPSATPVTTVHRAGRRLPCRFGDYELLAEIARGGMGVVYRAR